MAIQVNGTTVIDDSRNLSNVGGLKTVGGTSILGSGNIATGGSTTHYAVGTYLLAQHDGDNGTYIQPGSTTAGSKLRAAVVCGGAISTSPSGTWSGMGYCERYSNIGSTGRTTLFVRIS